MPIDPNIVSGLAPAAANLSQMGTFAQQQTAAQSQREYRDKQRKEQQIAEILGSSADDDEKVNLINALDIELGSKFRTQLDTHREKARKLFSDDLANDKAKIQMAARLMQGVRDKPTMDAARQMIGSLGDEGPQLAAMLPPEWDEATSPALIQALVDKGMEAEQYTDRQQKALDRSIKGEWRHGLAEALATSDDPAEAQGALAGWKAMGAPKVDTEPFEALVQNWSPDAKKKAGEMALSEQQRQTLAGQAATRDDAAAQRDIANARADQQLAISQEHLNLSRQANARAAQGGGSSAEGGGGLTPDAVDYIATQYRILGPSGIPTRISEGERIRIANAAASQVKSLGQSPVAAVQKQAAYKSDSAALTQMTKMREAAGSFENKAVAQADIVGQLSDKVGRTSSPMLNSWWLAGKKEVAGDTDTALLYNAIQTFASEYAKIMEGSTGSVAASSDSARKASENLIKASMSPKTTRAAIDLMKREMGLTMQGYDATIAHITERMGGAPTGAAPKETLGSNQRAIKGGGVAELRNGEWVRIR